jgi:hypothetical protein
MFECRPKLWPTLADDEQSQDNNPTPTTLSESPTLICFDSNKTIERRCIITYLCMNT